MSNLFSSNIMLFFTFFVILIIGLYLLTIFWTVKDAMARGANQKVWGLIALIPFLGCLIYVVLRPPLLLIDKEEQELDMALKRRQLSKYGECARCGQPVKDDFVVCPKCQSKLKDVCINCHKPLEFDWVACPYCGSSKVMAAPSAPVPRQNTRNTSTSNITLSANTSNQNLSSSKTTSIPAATNTKRNNVSSQKTTNNVSSVRKTHTASSPKSHTAARPSHTKVDN